VSEEFTVRRATRDDVETLVRLRHDMQVELHEEHHGVHPNDIVEQTREYFRRELSGKHFAAFFVEHEEEIAGTGALVVFDVPPGPSNPGGAEAYIMNMYTVPKYRRAGLATLIINTLIRHGYGEGARRFWLRASEQGRLVYEHLGFETPGHYMQRFVFELD
jgi:GNAT superfamily N-acetyltransferase